MARPGSAQGRLDPPGDGSGGSVPDVAVVVVTYDSRAWVDRCLGALPRALGALGHVVVVVDNASRDGTAEHVRTHHPWVRLLPLPHNTGFAAGVNHGVAASDSEFVLLLNPDTEARPGALEALVRFAREHPGHGIYGGRTLRDDGSLEPSSCWGLPSVWSTTCFAFGLSTAFPRSRLFDPESLGPWQRDTVRTVGMVSGGLLLTPRSVWDALGGLDERYFVYGEDADLNARARAAGYRPIVTPAAEVVHAVGASSSGSAKMPLLLAGKVTYARAHFGALAPLVLGLLRLGVAARALGARLTGRGTKWADAWGQRGRWWGGFPEAGGPRAGGHRAGRGAP